MILSLNCSKPFEMIIQTNAISVKFTQKSTLIKACKILSCAKINTLGSFGSYWLVNIFVVANKPQPEQIFQKLYLSLSYSCISVFSGGGNYVKLWLHMMLHMYKAYVTMYFRLSLHFCFFSPQYCNNSIFSSEASL